MNLITLNNNNIKNTVLESKKILPGIFIIFIFLAISGGFLLLDWHPAPLILSSGDAASVAGIIASKIFPHRFVLDPIYSHPEFYKSYYVLSIPLTKLAFFLTKDIGQAYVLLIAPIVFFQLLGFYLVGMRLFSHRGWAFLLSILCLAPVYVFTGELWGILAVPISRFYYGAFFPYVLLLLLKNNQKTYFPFLMMLICGLSIYAIYPLGPVSIAFASLISLLIAKPEERTWLKHIIVITAAGLLFLIVATPFILEQFHFSKIAVTSGTLDPALGAKYLAIATGPVYYDANMALSMLIHGGENNNSPTWGWVWIIWITGLLGYLFKPSFSKNPVFEQKLFAGFFIGLIASSYGAALLDQIIARYLHRMPVEIDLIRNLRYLVPLFLIGSVRFFASLSQRLTKHFRIALGVLMMVWVIVWFNAYPTSVSLAIGSLFSKSQSIELLSIDEGLNSSSNHNLLKYIALLPSNSKVLFFPMPLEDSPQELLESAIRYASFQPIVHTKKDLNFLSYSENRSSILKWQKDNNAIQYMMNAKPNIILNFLLKFTQTHAIKYVLVYTPAAKSQLIVILEKNFKPVFMNQSYILFALNKSMA